MIPNLSEQWLSRQELQLSISSTDLWFKRMFLLEYWKKNTKKEICQTDDLLYQYIYSVVHYITSR